MLDQCSSTLPVRSFVVIKLQHLQKLCWPPESSFHQLGSCTATLCGCSVHLPNISRETPPGPSKKERFFAKYIFNSRASAFGASGKFSTVLIANFIFGFLMKPSFNLCSESKAHGRSIQTWICWYKLCASIKSLLQIFICRKLPMAEFLSHYQKFLLWKNVPHQLTSFVTLPVNNFDLFTQQLLTATKTEQLWKDFQYIYKTYCFH